MKIRHLLYEQLQGGISCYENGRRIVGFISFEVKGVAKFNRIPVITPSSTSLEFSVPTADYFSESIPMFDFSRDGIFREIVEKLEAGINRGDWHKSVKVVSRTINSKSEFLYFYPPSTIKAEVQ